jgi:hypothetical protein
MRTIKTIFLVMLVLGCAKEQSKEERKREELRRSELRLAPVEGYFEGFIEVSSTRYVPFSVENRVVRGDLVKGTDSSAKVKSEIKLGLLGGVALGSTYSYFDHGNGEFVFNFNDGAIAGLNVELRGIVGKESLEDVYLNVSSGAYKATLKKALNKSDSNSDNDNFEYTLTNDDQMKSFGSLFIEKLSGSVSAPRGYDFSLQPRLSASVIALTNGVTRNQIKSVNYNILGGEIEFLLENEGLMRFTNVFADNPNNLGVSKVLLGELVQSGNKLANIRAEMILAGTNIPSNSNETVKYYKGYYHSSTGHTLNLIAKLIQNGEEVRSSTDSIFPDFPATRLDMYVCMGGKKIQKRVWNAYKSEPFVRELLFKDSKASSNQHKEMKIRISTNWKDIEGMYLTESLVLEGFGGEMTHTLTQLPEGSEFNCLVHNNELER